MSWTILNTIGSLSDTCYWAGREGLPSLGSYTLHGVSQIPRVVAWTGKKASYFFYEDIDPTKNRPWQKGALIVSLMMPGLLGYKGVKLTKRAVKGILDRRSGKNEINMRRYVEEESRDFYRGVLGVTMVAFSILSFIGSFRYKEHIPEQGRKYEGRRRF